MSKTDHEISMALVLMPTEINQMYAALRKAQESHPENPDYYWVELVTAIECSCCGVKSLTAYVQGANGEEVEVFHTIIE